MSNAWHLAVQDDHLGVLTFDLPGKSANIFTRPVLSELEALLEELAALQELRCLVLLSGKPDIFIAGADIDQIASVTDPLEAEAGSRLGQRLFSSWQALPFPTVAAIRGACVGGGTEIALASDHIVVSDRDAVRIGLPEVRLGILPGWGGCTRLPARIGIAAALDLILTGKTVSGRRAFKMGLADALIPDAIFLQQVRRFALERAGRTADHRPPSHLKDVLLERNPVGRKILFDQARKRTLGLTKGHYPAPLRAIEVVRVGAERGVSAGLDAEARAIGELAVGEVSKNLVHVFRLMEDNKRGNGKGPATRVRQVGILGAGVMGGGIAQLIAHRADLPVRLKDIAPEPLGHAMGHAAGLFQKQLRRHRLTKAEARRKMALIRPTTSYSGFGRTDLVIEAIVEKLEVKQAVFAEAAAALPDEAILATNTSSLSVDRIGEKTPHPERVAGMHFFNPVHKMPLVEVIAGSATSAETLATVASLARQLGKTPIVVRDAPGFLVNRILMFHSSEALWLLAEGQPIEEIDAVMRDWGMPMGPFALTDEVGLDVAVKVAHILQNAFSERLAFPDWLDAMEEPQRLGRKTGRGFYTYRDGKRQAPDPAVYSLLGIKRSESSVPPGQLVDRMLLPMVNEAARCLAEGIVATPGDVDLAMIMGTGFPPFRGGLCRWADSQGVEALAEAMERLGTSVGERFLPSEAYRRVVDAGGFYQTAWK